MEVTLVVAKVVALLAVAALCVYVIVLLTRVKQSMSTIERAVKDFALHVTPVLDNLEFLTAKATSLAETVEEHLGVVAQSVGTLRSITDNIADFERDIQARVEGPIRETAAVVRAVSKGVKTFFQRVRA
ncbi:MAG: hypothetical protein H6Q30_161 [Bacteroidetes bacterium]|jgi:uncharacterized protein YoxC|nr:hypothetical protein [Bacteroidota bacterium]